MRVMDSTSGIKTVVEPTAAWEGVDVEDREEDPIEPLLAGLMVGIL